MTYLKDFRDRIQNNDYPGFLKLWEEYCYGDEPDVPEILAILETIKASELAKPFGVHVERILPLWREIKSPDEAHEVLKLLFDLQTTNSESLAELALEYLQNRHANDPLLQEKLRLIGLRSKEYFPGAVRNFDLLSHMETGNFVFHKGGWGTGQILEVSLVREELSLEFEYVLGSQHFSFEKAFKTLLPLPKEHFYAQRFGNPDLLEKESRENPAEIIKLLLKDLGPKTAAEIKEEMIDLVIPAEDWNRWWQSARSKLKKDTKVDSPTQLKHPFSLREEELPHEVVLHKALEAKPGVNALIQMVYAFLRDFPETLKNIEFKNSLQNRLQETLSEESLNTAQKLQLFFLMEDLHSPDAASEIARLLLDAHPLHELILMIPVVSFQKRALQAAQKLRQDWVDTFLELFFSVEQNLVRDLILSELNTEKTQQVLHQKLTSLLMHPLSFPDVFVWYFQKLFDSKSTLPFSDSSGKKSFFEGLFILLDHVEKKPQHKELAKKILSLLLSNRYKLVRDLFQHSNLEEVKEYLLLATKCQSFADHDLKILHSLAEVVHPSLARLRKDKEPSGSEEDIIWSLQEGFEKTQARIEEIATVETVHNAKEIEAARALGDLRENAEFKAALERRDRLQSELKLLSGQLAKTRILTRADVLEDEVGVGSIVHCTDKKGEHFRYTLLGPWDADPENRVLSIQSKFAQAMKGKAVGETFQFQGESFTITEIQNYFD